MSHAIKFDPGRFEVTEDRERYEPGGFHPVNIGDSFESYRVLHKLGNGGFATIWLARDSKSDRNVALKIIAAEESRTCSEAEILQYLATTDSPTHEGKDRVSLLLDHFWIEGPNGRHRCLVSEALGPSIAQLREDNVVLSIRQSQKVALQASQGLAFLHSVGIIHGDFTTPNLLCHVDGIATWSEEEVYMYLGKPELDPLELATGEPYTGTNGPRALVERADMATVFREHLTDDISISIIDFGQAFRSSEPDVPDVGTPESYCAPELLFNGKASESSDAWALGCCLFEIRGSVQLFSSFMGNSTGTVRMMVQKFGKLPEPWWSEWDESRRKYFNEDGEPRTDWDRGIVLARKYPLEKAIQNIGVGAKYGTDANGVSTVGETSCWIPYPASPRVERAEARDLEDLLLRVLKYKPEERASVEAVCRHTWFISDYEGS